METIAVALSAWLAWRALAGDSRDGPAQWLGCGVMFVALVAGDGVVLGAVGGLNRLGFAVAQVGTLALLLASRRRQLRDDGRAARELLRAGWGAVRSDRPTFYLAAGLGIFVLVTGVLAALAEPVIYDALTYRLSRIGHWLQIGRVDFMVTNDPRQNYMPVVPDLVMAWLVSAFPAGFHCAALAQWLGGLLLIVATIGLARGAGLSRAAALGAAWLAAGTANVAPQFTTVHTDLLTAGLVAAACYLWQKAALNRDGSWVAGIGGGLALGAKGTVLYLGPTLLLWAVWTGWRHRLPPSAWRRTLLATLAGFALFALPGLARNWRAYGSPLGPPEFVSMHHQGAGGQLLHKTILNLGTSLVQVLEPNSQPPGLQAAARALAGPLVAALPEHDPFAYENLNRRETLDAINARTEPDADATSFGLPLLLLFGAGVVAAVFSRRTGAAEVRQWSAGVAVFFVFFHALQQWHPYGFRYFVLVAPWMAVIAAWGLAGLPPLPRRIIWVLALAAAAATSWTVLTQTHQAGWCAVVQPERARNYYVYRGWREWAGHLGQPGDPLLVALPFNRPLAAFYRLDPARVVQLQLESTLAGLTAERALEKIGDGWLLVPALQFMGNEGRVAARIWLFAGDPGSPFSIAAYHRLPPSATVEPMVYRHQVISGTNEVRHELLVRAGDGGRVTLHGESASAEGWRYVVTSPTEVKRGEWPGGACEITLVLPAAQVAEVVVEFDAPVGAPAGRPLPSLEVRP